SGEKQKDFRLERIGILELVDKNSFEASLKARPNVRIVTQKISGLEEKIEKIERTGFGFGELISINTAAELMPKRGSQIGVRVGLEERQVVEQIFTRAPDILAQHVVTIILASSFSRLFELTVMRELDQSRFNPIVVSCRDGFGSANLIGEFSRRPTICVQW